MNCAGPIGSVANSPSPVNSIAGGATKTLDVTSSAFSCSAANSPEPL
ncbi:MAG: hypothetical protein WKF81_02990 [Thermomicrobiales bacterium]